MLWLMLFFHALLLRSCVVRRRVALIMRPSAARTLSRLMLALTHDSFQCEIARSSSGKVAGVHAVFYGDRVV
jgi:hypothetical protein